MSDDGRDLILAAFAQARDSGKPDWRRMSIAVLKNRLLILTQHKFSESAFGATTFSDFVRLHGETVRADYSTFPPVLELREGLLADRPNSDVPPSIRGWRVRRDLWDAIVDYRSGRRYIWESSSQRAIPVDELPPGALVMPTLTPDDMQAWRDTFAEAQESSLDPAEQASLHAWRQRGLQTRGLPQRLRHVWNADMKRRVAERLERWFVEQHFSIPADFRESAEHVPFFGRDDLDSLRQLICRVVHSMTAKELSEIRLPATAILRATRGTNLGVRSLGVSPANEDSEDR